MAGLETLDEIVQQYCISSSPSKSRLYIGLGILFTFFAIIGIWIPGWPTVSWAVPAAYFFSISSERLFRWTLTNQYFGEAIFQYYSSGKTIPKHAKNWIIVLIISMTTLSAIFIWYVSTLGEGKIFDPATWDGADPGFGSITVIIVGLIGVWYVGVKIPERK